MSISKEYKRACSFQAETDAGPTCWRLQNYKFLNNITMKKWYKSKVRWSFSFLFFALLWIAPKEAEAGYSFGQGDLKVYLNAKLIELYENGVTDRRTTPGYMVIVMKSSEDRSGIGDYNREQIKVHLGGIEIINMSGDMDKSENWPASVFRNGVSNMTDFKVWGSRTQHQWTAFTVKIDEDGPLAKYLLKNCNLNIETWFNVEINNDGDPARSSSGQIFYNGNFSTTNSFSLTSVSSESGCNTVKLTVSPGSSYDAMLYSTVTIDGNKTYVISGNAPISTDPITSTALTGNGVNPYTINTSVKSKTICVSSNNNVTIPIYTQPSSADAVIENCSKGIKVKWEMPEYKAHHNLSQSFNVYRSTNSGTKQLIKTISFDKNTRNYEYIDTDVKEDETYTYFVARHPWDISCSSVSTNAILATFNRNIPSVPVISTKGKDGISITWQNPSTFCSNIKTRLIIHNLNTGAEVTKNLAEGATSYTMKSVQLCTKYAFTVVYSNDLYGDIEGPQSESVIVSEPIAIGPVLTVSKGYYTDKVTLQWESPTPALVEDWVVSRRELPNGTEYSQVSRFKNDNSDLIYFEDVNGSPGVLYEYKVSGTAKCADTNFWTAEIKSIGFRQPLGMVLGAVSYGEGVPVPNVTLIAEVLEDNAYLSKGKSLSFAGNGYVKVLNSNTLFDANNFSAQVWVKPDMAPSNQVLLKKNGQFELGFNNDQKLQLIVGTQALVSNVKTDSLFNGDRYTHVSVVYDKQAAYTLKIYINGNLIDSSNATPTISQNNESLFVGASSEVTTGNGFKGNIDEIRMWTKALTAEEIAFNYSGLLSGKETGIGLYLRGEESIDSLRKDNGNVYGEVYDLSQDSYLNTYNANHAQICNVKIDKVNIPTKEQLGFKGKTDQDGAYTIMGIPYAGSGTSYRITPWYGVHEFKPKTQTLFIGNASIVHNNINFTDISSFRVRGKVYYAGTTVPVAGVMFAVDGNTCLRDGKIIETDVDGNYEIRVPIGFHSVTASKTGHVFATNFGGPIGLPNSRFPSDTLAKYDFQTEENLDFLDLTKVELIGRFVGGPVEAAKPVGFGVTNNNIGTATITLELQPQGMLDLPGITDSIVSMDTSSNHKIGTRTVAKNGQNRIEVTFSTNAKTGEFVAYLLPETYKIKATGNNRVVKAGTNELPYANDIVMQVNRKTIYLYDKDTAAPALANNENEFIQDTTQGKVTDSTTAHQTLNLIYRVNPSIEVVDANIKDTLFGERTLVIKDPKTAAILDTLDLIQNNRYVFGHPIFKQQGEYDMTISVFEKYINADNAKEDRVPTVDGTINVSNNMAALAGGGNGEFAGSGNVLKLNEKGTALYSFAAGGPNVNTNVNKPEENYLKNLNFHVSFPDGTSASWRTEDLNTYVIGLKNDGSDFVTKGPKVADFILRDPPGSNSFAWIEKGSVLETTHEWGGRFSNETGLNTEMKFGMEMTTWVGVGGGTATTVGATNTTNLNLSTTNTGGRDNVFTSTTTVNKRIETSSDPLYTGTFGDVFVGKSYNLIFGEAMNIAISDTSKIANPAAKLVTGKSGKVYAIGSFRDITTSIQFETDFQFTYHYIMFELIPDLEKIRNVFFTHYGDGGNKIDQNPSTQPYYVSKVSMEDERLGSRNKDKKVWGNAANTATISDGPSYYVVYPDAWRPDTAFVDSVEYWNQEIQAWYQLLAQNEKEKVTATKIKNVSFDAGVVIEETQQFDEVSGYTLAYDGELKVDANTQFGTDIAGTGVDFTIVFNNKGSWFDNKGEQQTNTVIYGYHLEDSEDDDYLTVDILKPVNNSTAYRVLGGQSSCPYQDEELTEFFEAGQHVIHQATARVEDPDLKINTSFQNNIPGNRPAYFTLTLGNNSFTEDVYYILEVEESTNPDGLDIKIDNNSLAKGRTFLLPSLSSINKTLTVSKTRPDINEYDSIRLVLHSTCQYDPSNNRPDIYSEVYLSVHFLPSCSDLKLTTPVNNQIVNTYTGDQVNIEVAEFDVNYINFNSIVLEQKSVTENAYGRFAYYYKDQTAYDADITTPVEMKHLIGSNAVISHTWTAPTTDGKYHIRAKALCPAGAATIHESETEMITIVKDMASPVPFGALQPGDGILSIGDDIIVTFNEDILEDRTYRINVKGELNGDELKHHSGLYFDGVNDEVAVTQPMNLSGKSFTVEFWMLRDGTPKEATLFAHGNTSEKFEIGLTANDELKISVNNQTTTSSAIPDLDRSWTHISAVYDATTKLVSAYVNGNSAAAIAGVNMGNYTATGNIIAGTDFEKSKSFHGRMNELRIWNKLLSPSIISTQMNTKLSGTELGLSAYWPMDEARGTKVPEIIRGRHGITNAEWFVLPAGKSLAFDGNSQYAQTGILPEMESTIDFSVEFWFKADPDNADACLFSTGRGDNQEYQPGQNKFSIYFDHSKILTLRSANKTVAIGQGYADNDWHHFALSVSRKANANVYIDGELKHAINASDYFGMFSGKNLWIGAMGWETSSTQTMVNNFFKGNIDDLRIWKSALTRAGINLAASSRLKGDELGLKAYYPFDSTQSATIILGTLMDQRLKDTTGNETILPNVPFKLFGGADFSNTAANIKPVRMMKNVNFERVYTHNAIQIKLDEPMSKIENCVLEISVADVQDMNGNRLQSPVRWTAFIDQNYLKWSEESLAFEKKEFEPLAFKVKIMNKYGTEQSFSIDNLPSWLSVSQQTGIIGPSNSIEVTFTINEGLNIGTYDENIYLRNADGANELLAISIRVFGEKPDWSVDPSKFNYSMNVFGELSINGIVSTDAEDMLAAFTGATCVGVSKLKYVPEYDRYIAFLNVYGNKSGEPLKFKIWDASTGRTYPMVTPDTLVFKENSYYGTAGRPITFVALNYIDQQITLKEGWNWISKNVNTPSMTTVAGTLTNYPFAANDQLKSQFNGFDQYTGSNWAGSISSSGGMSHAQMYMLKVRNAGALTITGEPVDASAETITTYPGWTWLGFTPQINLAVNEAFVGANPQTGDLVKSQNSFSIYDEKLGWIGSLNYLLPGNGYVYYSTAQNEQTFTYPTVSMLTDSRGFAMRKQMEKSLEDHQVNVANYKGNLSIIAQVEGDEWGSESILCYVDEECRGLGMAQSISGYKNNLYFITVGGNTDGDNLTFRLKTKNGKVLSLKERFSYVENRRYGTLETPVIFTVGEGEATDVMVHPNPFVSTLTVDYNVAKKGQTTFSLKDMTGRTIFTFDMQHENVGNHSIELGSKVKSLPSGVYFLQIGTKEKNTTVKIIKQ